MASRLKQNVQKGITDARRKAKGPGNDKPEFDIKRDRDEERDVWDVYLKYAPAELVAHLEGEFIGSLERKPDGMGGYLYSFFRLTEYNAKIEGSQKRPEKKTDAAMRLYWGTVAHFSRAKHRASLEVPASESEEYKSLVEQVIAHMVAKFGSEAQQKRETLADRVLRDNDLPSALLHHAEAAVREYHKTKLRHELQGKLDMFRDDTLLTMLEAGARTGDVLAMWRDFLRKEHLSALRAVVGGERWRHHGGSLVDHVCRLEEASAGREYAELVSQLLQAVEFELRPEEGV